MNTAPTVHKPGLVLLGLLAAADLSTPFLADGEHPPMSVALISLGLGAASLAFLPAAWRGRRSAVVGMVATRLVSALLTLPAFFIGGVPAGAVAVAAGILALTVLGVVLTLAGARQEVAA